jgi:hypothetical protein
MGGNMKRLGRSLVVVLVIVYAGWIAWPVLSNWLLPDYGPQAPTYRMDNSDYTGRSGLPVDVYAPEAPIESIQGENALNAVASGDVPVFVLWGAVIGLYLVAAFLHANGNLRATAAYTLGFIADLALTFMDRGEGGGGPLSQIIALLSDWDPRYVLTLFAMLLGFLIYMSRQKPEDRITGIADARKFIV